jgi:tetratricopeptide (TPR) repeat protein
VIEDTMFFPRLRRHAKWMFLLLALAFALGFVAFGVGAGGVGVGDIFRGSGGGSGAPSISDAEKRTLENPKDAKAFRDLATAHAAAGNTDEAIQALESLVSLRPKDADALRQLAAQYLQKLDDAQQQTQIAQIRAAYLAPGMAVGSALQLGSTPLDDPISSAISNAITAESSTSFTDAQQAASQYVETYRRLAATDPRDASLQLEFAQQAESVGDTTAALEGYRAFLTIPNIDPAQQADVRRRLKQLSQVTTG